MKKTFLLVSAILFSQLASADPGEAVTKICGLEVKLSNVDHPARGITVEDAVSSIIRYGATPHVCLIEEGVAVVTEAKTYDNSAMVWRVKK